MGLNKIFLTLRPILTIITMRQSADSRCLTCLQHHNCLCTNISKMVCFSSFQIENEQCRSGTLRKVLEVLAFAREIGPIGVDAPQEDQDKLFQLSQVLLQFWDPNPSDVPLRGIRDMVYSTSAGSSSGKLFGRCTGR